MRFWIKKNDLWQNLSFADVYSWIYNLFQKDIYDLKMSETAYIDELLKAE